MLPPIALVPSLLHPCCLGTREFSKRTSSSPFLLLFSSLLFSPPSVSSRVPLPCLWEILSGTPLLYSPSRHLVGAAPAEPEGSEKEKSSSHPRPVKPESSPSFRSAPSSPHHARPRAHSCTPVAFCSAYPCVLPCPGGADLCCRHLDRKATASVLRTLLSALFPPLLLCSALSSLIVNSRVSAVLLRACALSLYALARASRYPLSAWSACGDRV